MTASGWDRLVKRSRESSALLLSTLDPLLIRDRKGVLQMAVLTTDSPLLATCILSPGFLTRFSALFGPELVSTELLEISKKGIKAIGNIDPSDR